VKQSLADKNISVLKHPFVTGFSPCDFYLFSKVQNALKGTHFQFADEVILKMTNLPNRVIAGDPQHCSEQWKIRMHQSPLCNPILPHLCYML
jgi:hypothetical protein